MNYHSLFLGLAVGALFAPFAFAFFIFCSFMLGFYDLRGKRVYKLKNGMRTTSKDIYLNQDT